MEPLFESRREVRAIAGRVRAVVARPTLEPEPVLMPDAASDGTGASIYGTVLRDGGRFRMWYQAWPKDWDGRDAATVGYAESEDGFHWRKPALGLVPEGPLDNNLTDLGLHSPSVFIDPTASAAWRYRATGHARAARHAGVARDGYYTAHSADGLHWVLDGPAPRWPGGDVITSAYHLAQGRALVAMKHNPWIGGFRRRAVWQAEMREGAWSEPHAALLPDAYDDVAAGSRGYASADYYGMGLVPAGSGTVGLLWRFWHSLPRTPGSGHGIFGVVDVGLAYQAGPGEAWLQPYSRADWLSHDAAPWTTGGIYTASTALEVGDEQWLYVTGALRSHGWYLDERWQLDQARFEELRGSGGMRIGLARWPGHRFFGLQADPAGTVDLDLGVVSVPTVLHINYVAEPGGSIRVEVLDQAGHSLADALALEGQAVSAPVAWRQGTLLSTGGEAPLTARLHMERATAYAYALRSAPVS